MTLDQLIAMPCADIRALLPPSGLPAKAALAVAACMAGASRAGFEDEIPTDEVWNSLCFKFYACDAASWPVDEAALTNALNALSPAPSCLSAEQAMGIFYCFQNSYLGPDRVANGACWALAKAPWYGLKLASLPLCTEARAMLNPVPACADEATTELVQYCRTYGVSGPNPTNNAICWLTSISSQLEAYALLRPCSAAAPSTSTPDASSYVPPSVAEESAAAPVFAPPPGAEGPTSIDVAAPEELTPSPVLSPEVVTLPTADADASRRMRMIAVGVGVGVLALAGIAYGMSRKRRRS